jgi:cyclic-di-GMP phosphodiesterase TipF (flagellum assembly factor)
VPDNFTAVISSLFAGMVHRSFRLDMASAAFVAAILILFLFQLGGAISRRRAVRAINGEIEDLRSANFTVASALDETRKRLAEATFAMATKSEAQEKKLVGELQMIESLIRNFAAKVKHEQAAQTARPPTLANAGVLSEPALLEIIRRALEENRIDLYLQPVVSLPQRKIRFYEVLSRLRSEDGTVIMPEQFIKVAAPAGLMSVVDNLLLFRCVQIVRRLAHKHRDVGVFCNISGHTLRDSEFFPQFLEFMHHHRDLAAQIIFEFAQGDVLAAGPAEQANLRYLANLGFRLSLDTVTALDMDFARARRLGFQFLKLRAGTLLSAMKDARAPVSAEDLKDLLGRNGLKLIVERVEEEKTVVQLLECNVDFGQGYLFGEPRAIREIAEANDPRAVQPATSAVLTSGLARRLTG